ncbi:hypothetical protein HMPREF9120_01478 [Neisseria sp. oral taxon 020 str. F0370]|nr:hypothetical protein HMPREF9120_01478 [Neisseria sp. oral taxon 020 str. F0370]
MFCLVKRLSDGLRPSEKHRKKSINQRRVFYSRNGGKPIIRLIFLPPLP